MWHLRTLAVAAVAVSFAVGTGCVTQTKYNRDVMAAQRETDTAQRQLAQVKKDLKAAQEKLAAMGNALADLKVARKDASEQKDRADTLQSQLAETQKACDLARKELSAEKKRRCASSAVLLERGPGKPSGWPQGNNWRLRRLN